MRSHPTSKSEWVGMISCLAQELRSSEMGSTCGLRYALVFLDEIWGSIHMYIYIYNSNSIKSKSLSDHKVQLVFIHSIATDCKLTRISWKYQFVVRDITETGREKGRHSREGDSAAVWRLVGSTVTKNISQHRELEIKKSGALLLWIGNWTQKAGVEMVRILKSPFLFVQYTSRCVRADISPWILVGIDNCQRASTFYTTLLVQISLLVVTLTRVCLIAIRGWCLWAPLLCAHIHTFVLDDSHPWLAVVQRSIVISSVRWPPSRSSAAMATSSQWAHVDQRTFPDLRIRIRQWMDMA